MRSNRWTVDEIRSALWSHDSNAKYYAAFQLSQMQGDVEDLIPDLIQVIDRAITNVNKTLPVERTVVGMGAVALSKFLSISQNNLDLRLLAEKLLIELAKSPKLEFSATGVSAIGAIGVKGSFGWTVLMDIAKSSHEKFEGVPVTLAALAYRAMLNIDFARCNTLGNIPSKQELRIALQYWLTLDRSPKSTRDLQDELEKLQ